MRVGIKTDYNDCTGDHNTIINDVIMNIFIVDEDNSGITAGEEDSALLVGRNVASILVIKMYSKCEEDNIVFVICQECYKI
jgi:hypothetical protein